ncbi:MAG: cobalamin-dependent protein, partial [Anaerolineae bacterium]|nr:cobalamin-dependent protein [Anaerolineae bacterium]
MPDIILVNFRSERDMYPPFGIMYVADALTQQGLTVELWHENGEGVERFVQRVEEVRPLWVGISTITGPQLAYAINATRQVHAMGIPTVWGGVHATIMPEDVLKEDYVDFIIVNEGEVTAQEFTRELQNGRNWGKVLGLAWKNEQGQAVVNPERPFIQNLDDFSPRW